MVANPFESLNLQLDFTPKKPSLAQRRKLTVPVSLALPTEESELRKEELPKEFLAEYDLGTRLGNGTVAVVKLARRLSDDRQFAVKHVRSGDEEMRQFTRDEYDLVRTLNHPGIIRFDAIYENLHNVLICMEFCSDGDVSSFIRDNGAFTEDRIRSLGLQMLRGVNHLHHKRVCHRDLKPENMLLQKNASMLKITDFNSAKRIGKCNGSSLMLTDRGTREYAAPELRFGLCWNERVDVWSCGLCLYFMRRGYLPFNIQDESAKLDLFEGKLPDVDWNGFSENFQSLTKQCLIVNMHDRPQAMELCWHRVFGNRRWVEGDVSSRSRCYSGSPEKETVTNQRLPETFTFLPTSGLLALHAGRFLCDLSANNIESPQSSGKKRMLPTELSGAMTCYQFEVLPSVRIDGGDQDALKSPSTLQMPIGYARYRAPRHFDALLQLAAQKSDRLP